jgi:hypothetical protein
MEFYNLGNYEVTGVGINKFNVGLPPTESKTKYLTALLIYANCIGTATGEITKKTFLAEACKQVNLYINNRLIVDNMDGESLNRLNIFYGGLQFPDYKTPSVSEAGSYSETFLVQVPFSFDLMVDKYDLAKSLNQIKSLTLEYKRGNIDGLTSMTLKVVAVVEERENEYISPEMRIRRFTISKQISDTIQIANRTIAGFWQLPATGSLDDIAIIRTTRKTILDNLPLSTLNTNRSLPVIFDDLQGSDLNYLYVIPSFDIPISLKKPTFFEGENIFFDDLSPANSPFYFVMVEVMPPESVGSSGEPILESRVSPIKVNA